MTQGMRIQNTTDLPPGVKSAVKDIMLTQKLIETGRKKKKQNPRRPSKTTAKKKPGEERSHWCWVKNNMFILGQCKNHAHCCFINFNWNQTSCWIWAYQQRTTFRKDEVKKGKKSETAKKSKDVFLFGITICHKWYVISFCMHYFSLHVNSFGKITVFWLIFWVYLCTESKATVAKASNSPKTKKNRKEKLHRLHQAAAQTKTKEPGRSLDVCGMVESNTYREFDYSSVEG